MGTRHLDPDRRVAHGRGIDGAFPADLSDRACDDPTE